MHYDPDVQYVWEEMDGSGVKRLVVPGGWLYWCRGVMTYVPLPSEAEEREDKHNG